MRSGPLTGKGRWARRRGVSVREFCRRRQLPESQFYKWRRKLRAVRPERTPHRPRLEDGAASFVLVREEADATDAGIELVRGGGRRLRIRKGVDEETLRAVRAALEPAGC